MDEAYHAALRAFAGGAARAVLVEGLGGRAFCSGMRKPQRRTLRPDSSAVLKAWAGG